MTDMTALFLSKQKLLLRVVGKIVPFKEAEDIVQETYIKTQAVKNKSNIKEPAAFMVQVAKNLALDYIKSPKYKNSINIDDELIEHLNNINAEQNQDCTYEKTASAEEFNRFCKEVENLPEKCRNVFILKKIYGYTQKEIAEKEGISESTVEKHIAYGTKQLFNLMKKKGISQPSKSSQYRANPKKEEQSI